MRLDAFRHFVGQRLDVDPDVTALVGRNDTGKTSFLLRFLHQHFYLRVNHGSDSPKLPNASTEPIRFSLVWDTDARDSPPALQSLFRVTDRVRRIESRFDGAVQPSGAWSYYVNDSSTPTAEPLKDHSAFPRPHYVNVGPQLTPSDRNLLPTIFEAQLVEQGPPSADHLRTAFPIPAESLLLKLAHFGSTTRRSSGRGYEDPWAQPRATPGPSLAELRGRLADVSRDVTNEIRKWWHEPPGLTFEIAVGGSAELNSYGFAWEVRTDSGLRLHGAGLTWFISFVLEVLYIRAVAAEQTLFVFDEPGAPLHPSAQRAVLRMLTEVTSTSGNQLIYSTHSPFMLDWSFPQRVRLFERDYSTGRTSIVNKPYAPTTGFARIWDPLRSAIGVTLGDVSLVGRENVLVEGVSDQIILANASAFARLLGEPHLPFPEISIVPYGDVPALERLLDEAARLGATNVGVVDSDAQAAFVEPVYVRRRVGAVRLDRFSDTSAVSAAIEDVVGVDDYVRCVNAFYGSFTWFQSLDPLRVATVRGTATLGKWLEEYFVKQFGRSFSKVAVATLLADSIESLSTPARVRLFGLIREILRVLGR
ncbi:MAG TPA: AAA family ATPase [Vicinamibacterales bacterium]|nr:AAA family ATPase [Vicinamibacterales bacterium]